MIPARISLVTGCAAAALGGYLLARHPMAMAEKEVANVAINTRADDRRVAEEVTHKKGSSALSPRTPPQLAAFKKDLLERFSTAACPDGDWELRRQAAALLATLSTEELQGFARELISASPQATRWFRGNQALLQEVFKQWGLKDPAGACLESTSGLRGVVFDDWLRRDPAAAQAWLTAGNFPPDKEKEGAQLRKNFLNNQAAEDFSKARESLAMLDPETQKETLLNWSQQLALTPEKRDDLLALVVSRGDPDLTLQCYERLVREMAVKSPWEASKFLENTSLPDEQKHALSEQMLGEWASQDPQQAFAAWAALKEDQAPAQLLTALRDWSINSPGAEQAIEWVNKLDASPARGQFQTQLIQYMSRVERYDQAAELGSSMADPTERIRQMKIVKRMWEEKFPRSANEWYDKLPQSDKTAMERKLD